jgi:hypothetical protein
LRVHKQIAPIESKQLTDQPEGKKNSVAKMVFNFPEQAANSENDGDMDDTIVIKTTAQKLEEVERQLMTIQNLNTVPDSLAKFSLRACLFQFAQAIVLYYFASKSTTQWTWYTSFPLPEEDALSQPPTAPDPQQIAEFSILWYSPVFITMSGIEHACCLLFREQYCYYIARNQNPFRWTEYTFSASLMRVMVAQFAGITDIHLLICIAVLAAMTMQLGCAHEVFNAKSRADGLPQNWRCFFLAWLCQMTSWIMIFNYFAMRVRGGDQPDFIWVIIIIMFLLDSSFAITFSLQWLKIPPFDGTSPSNYYSCSATLSTCHDIRKY